MISLRKLYKITYLIRKNDSEYKWKDYDYMNFFTSLKDRTLKSFNS